ncbi:MAG: hypothetical protein PHV68_08560, partial [Candidatus Gastranaerophilales bacterium]|nr:hypothetical protein [Candidatus Gastranaerophilales bacterium]
IITDNGGTLAGAFPGDHVGAEDLKNAYISKLNIIKDCSGNSEYGGGSGTGASLEGCWHESANWYYLNGTTLAGLTQPGMILNNGSLLVFKLEKSACNNPNGDFVRCGWFYVDVNGFKKPNTLGKDIFASSILTNISIPYGARGSYDPSTTCIEGSTETDNHGTGCSAKYLYE